MARYAQNFAGERRTSSVGFKLTLSERADIEAAADALGLPLSAHLRALCIKSSPTVAGNPQARAVLRELAEMANNLNHLAKYADRQRELPALSVLKIATDAVKSAMAHVLEL